MSGEDAGFADPHAARSAAERMRAGAIAPITVRWDGAIAIDGSIYWDRDLLCHSGCQVSVRRDPKARTWVQVWSLDGTQFLCCADMIVDGAQRAAEQRSRAARIESIIRRDRQIGLEQADRRPVGEPLVKATVQKLLSRRTIKAALQCALRAVPNFWIGLGQRVEQGKDDHSEGVDVEAGFPKATAQRRQALIGGHRHSQAPFKSSAKQPATSGGAGHRLSEDSE